MNVEHWIRDALQELQVQAAEQPITNDQMATGIRYANRLMAGVDYLGLGYSVVSSSGDDVTIPPYAEEWAVSALAARMAPQFTPTETLVLVKQNEREAFRNLLLQHQELTPSSYPPTLPLGSGNHNCSGARYYPGDGNSLTSETGQIIIAEDDT